MKTPLAQLVLELGAHLRLADAVLARIQQQLPGTATSSAPAMPSQGLPAPKVKPCSKCGGRFVWGAFGDDRPALLDPDSLAGGYETRMGRFGPVPRFERARGHRLHTCTGGAR